MKKIYLQPKTKVTCPSLESFLIGESPLDPNNPTSGLGGNDPGNGGNPGDDEGDDWGGAKGRGMWDRGGLW